MYDCCKAERHGWQCDLYVPSTRLAALEPGSCRLGHISIAFIRSRMTPERRAAMKRKRIRIRRALRADMTAELSAATFARRADPSGRVTVTPSDGMAA